MDGRACLPHTTALLSTQPSPIHCLAMGYGAVGRLGVQPDIGWTGLGRYTAWRAKRSVYQHPGRSLLEETI